MSKGDGMSFAFLIGSSDDIWTKVSESELEGLLEEKKITQRGNMLCKSPQAERSMSGLGKEQ